MTHSSIGDLCKQKWKFAEQKVSCLTQVASFSKKRNLETSLNHVRVAELARVAGHPQGPMRKLKADENDIFNGEP